MQGQLQADEGEPGDLRGGFLPALVGATVNKEIMNYLIFNPYQEMLDQFPALKSPVS